MITFANLGRLGRFTNGMFQIAGTIGIAKANGYDFSFPEWKNYDHRDRFGSNEDIDVQKYFVNPLPVCEDPGKFPSRWVDWGYHGLNFPDNISLNGHFQAPKYFMHCIDTVKHYFRMKDEPNQNEMVAIHYRAGDYTEGKDTYHPRCSWPYYSAAIKQFPEGTEFKVFSDDYDYAVQMFKHIDNVCFSPKENDYIQDFKQMKICKSFITANSSFSLMAAILGDHPEKKIVCPKLWFGAVAGINGDDCYPENAIVL